MKERIEGREGGVPGVLGDKQFSRRFAASLGVQTARILGRPVGLDFLFDTLPTRFVLKPSFGSTSLGVYLLERRPDGSLVDLTRDQTITRAEIVETELRICQHFGKDPASAEFIFEELIASPDGEIPPQDVRFYAFQGEIGLILREDHMHEVTRAMYFGPEFLPLPRVEDKYSVHPAVSAIEEIVPAVVPVGSSEMLAVAKRISVAIPSPFARIDLLFGERGVYLGEITLYPGTFYYGNRKIMSSGEQARLGELWASAESRLCGSDGQLVSSAV